MPRRLALTASLATLTVLSACRPPGDGGAASAGDTADSSSPAAASPRTPSGMPAGALPSTPAGDLVRRSIAFHDPDGVWWSGRIALRWVSTRPGGEERLARLRMERAGERFLLAMKLRGHTLDLDVAPGSAHTLVDGSPDVPATVRELLRLDREDGSYWRNYFLFLVGLPMKLADPGADILPDVGTADLAGRTAEVVRVRYDTGDGYPWWAFYFDPGDARLVGARFWREGPDADGEHITMDGLAGAGSLRLPGERSWYTNAEGEYLGTDRVEGLEVGSG